MLKEYNFNQYGYVRVDTDHKYDIGNAPAYKLTENGKLILTGNIFSKIYF